MTDISLLISGHLDHSLSREEAQELNAWIKADPANAVRFAREVFLHSCILDLLVGEHYLRGQTEPERCPPGAPLRRNREMHAASDVAGGWRANSSQAPGKDARQHWGRWRRQAARWRIAASIIVVLSLLIALWRPWNSGKTWSAPTLVNAIDAQWDGAAPTAGDALPQGSPLTLKSGLIQVSLADDGAMIFEGPATFTIQSPKAVFLDRGRMVARIPGGGLVVNTPTARLTDLGTEFGVNVGNDATQVAVFDGKVQAAPANAAENAPPLTLAAGQAARIAAGRVAADANGAIPQHFVRSLARNITALDVVDLIAGGDGTTHRRGVGIDVRNGDWGALPQAGSMAPDWQYHRVPALTVVDGVFSPDGSRGSVTVDSQGHAFAFRTSFSGSFMHIWAGGSIPAPPQIPPGNAPMSPVLAGVDYSQDGHGLLAMHSNKGLTLDLLAIRRLHPGQALICFRSLVGNSWLPWENSAADVFVLVDGQRRFSREKFTAREGAIPVETALREEDRFLTLVVTDGNDSTITFDHVLWADPVLDLGSRRR